MGANVNLGRLARSLIALYAIVVTRTSRPTGPLDSLLAAALRGELDEPGARQLSNRGPEVTTLALLALAQRIAELRSQAQSLNGAAATLATVLTEWYEQLAEEAKKSAVLHADEIGWRVDGQTHWLWCFANHSVCYYMIDRCRGSPALQKFFGEAFEGTLIHDFRAPYESLETADRQYGLVHLPRELEKVDMRNVSEEWQTFAKKLRRLIRDGIRLRKRADFSSQRYRRRIHLIDARLTPLAQWQRPDGTAVYADADALRLAKRLRAHWDHLFTFLDKPDVPFDNNLAERCIRPAVILRKNSYANRSQQGAATQAVLMTVYRTLKLRGHNPTQSIAAALQTCLATGELPHPPAPAIADG